MSLEPGTCRSCGARILWVKTKTGRPMPLDPPIVAVWDPTGGIPEGAKTITITTADGRTVRGLRDRPLLGGELVAGHISHFATCPQAKDHRTR